MDDNESRIRKLASEVIDLSRNAIFLHLRFLDLAVGQFNHIPADCGGIMTDGEHIVYDPRFVLRRYRKAQEIPARDYLHMVMHCIFKHMYMSPELDRTCWNIACDIAVENVITELGVHAFCTDNERKQEAWLTRIRQDLGTVTAEKLYAELRSGKYSQNTMQELAELFGADNHMLWYLDSVQAGAILGLSLAVSVQEEDDDREQREKKNGEDDREGEPKEDEGESKEGEGEQRDGEGDRNGEREEGAGEECQEQVNRNSGNSGRRADQAQTWQDIAERVQLDLETFSRQQGTKSGSMVQNLKEVTREKYDYAAFLKKFAVLGEVMKVNDDEFDYIFYTYGLKLYEKMPLIEPLEYKEVKRIREFVIAIDTSGSTSGELVQTFLQKTYNILLDSESFFSKVNVHIIQCDANIQEDAKITNREEFDTYIKNMRIRGLGGTDFRPVFQYVNEMINRKEFINLKGLIYFTDGFGTFPKVKPDYETAFVFIDDGFNNNDVPPWAIKLMLRRDEI